MAKGTRIAITLNPELYETIKYGSEVFEKPMSKVVAEFLTELHPQIHQIIEMVEVAKRDQEKALSMVETLISTSKEQFDLQKEEVKNLRLTMHE